VNERGLVDVPENAVRDEPIAFGLTAVQLGICAVAVVVAAVFNLVPTWEPIRLVLVLVGALVIVAEVKGARASGATRWLSPGRAIIQLSLRYRWEDHFWFSFFHVWISLRRSASAAGISRSAANLLASISAWPSVAPDPGGSNGRSTKARRLPWRKRWPPSW
jgi:hypothetical protein